MYTFITGKYPRATNHQDASCIMGITAGSAITVVAVPFNYEKVWWSIEQFEIQWVRVRKEWWSYHQHCQVTDLDLWIQHLLPFIYHYARTKWGQTWPFLQPLLPLALSLPHLSLMFLYTTDGKSPPFHPSNGRSITTHAYLFLPLLGYRPACISSLAHLNWSLIPIDVPALVWLGKSVVWLLLLLSICNLRKHV